MLRSPSSLLRLSRHLLRPVSARLSSPRFLSSPSSSSSPVSGGAGWTTYDPFADTLGPPAAAPSASDSETPAEPDAWGIYDPVTGRIVMRGVCPPIPSSSNADEAVAEKAGAPGKEWKKAAVKVKREKAAVMGEARPSGGKGKGSRSSVASPRKPEGKAGKESVSYVCTHCGEGGPRWWGYCRHCQAVGTLRKFVPGTGADSTEASQHALGSSIPQKNK